MHLVRRNARSVPWIIEETLAPVRRQNSIDHDVGPRTSKPSSPSEVTNSKILRGYCKAKGPGCLSPFQISSPRPAPKSKKWSRTDEESPGLQIVQPKIVVSSVGHKHRRERRQVTQGGPPEDREGDLRPYGLAIEGWWRDNPWRSHHLRIKYTQLTLWPRWCGCDSWTARWGP